MSAGLKLEQQEGNVPPGWDLVAIDEVCTLGGGKTPRKGNDDYWHGSIPWVSPKDFEGVTLGETEDNLTQAGVSENSINLYESGDIAMVVRSGVLRHSLPVAQLESDMAVNQDIKVLQPDYERIASDYLLNILLYEADRIRASCVKTGTTVESVETAFLKAYKLPLPPLPEQRRIADILSTVDEQIQQTDEMIEKTEELKRGLMQDLFRPKISGKINSTKLGDIPDSWEIGSLQSYEVDFISGGTPSRDSDEYFGGAVPWLKTGEIQNNRVFDAEEHITELGLTESSAKLLPEGSVLVAMYGATAGNVGLLQFEAATNQACCAVIPDDSNLLNEFLYYQLLFDNRRLKSYSAGSGQQNLSKGLIQTFDILVPPLEEQQRIVRILSKVDEKLTTERETNQFLQELKRGLMQDLLTGKVRVNTD